VLGSKQLFAATQSAVEPPSAPLAVVTSTVAAKADGAIAVIATRAKTPNSAPVGFDFIVRYDIKPL